MILKIFEKIVFFGWTELNRSHILLMVLAKHWYILFSKDICTGWLDSISWEDAETCFILEKGVSGQLVNFIFSH